MLILRARKSSEVEPLDKESDWLLSSNRLRFISHKCDPVPFATDWSIYCTDLLSSFNDIWVSTTLYFGQILQNMMTINMDENGWIWMTMNGRGQNGLYKTGGNGCKWIAMDAMLWINWAADLPFPAMCIGFNISCVTYRTDTFLWTPF